MQCDISGKVGGNYSAGLTCCIKEITFYWSWLIIKLPDLG